MSCLVLGRKGQVATHLGALLEDAVFWGRDECDLNATGQIAEAIIALAPSVIVNAAAYTAVDAAESEPEAAWRLNALAAGEAARAARALDVPIVQISTDYVFDGAAERPYRAGDAVNPLNTYGKTKLGGEIAVATLAPKHWILRTSWVFSEVGTNFVKTMIRLGHERDHLEIVADRHGVPTHAGDLSAVIAALVAGNGSEALGWGTYHAIGGPATTWFEFARLIFSRARDLGLVDREIELNAISTSTYLTSAARPANSVLASSPEIRDVLGVDMDWHRGLEATLSRLAGRRLGRRRNKENE
jgi:dTDP-4-dehydrorhamnose reductase